MTNIQWTDKTWNWLVGCSRISPGCANCYAAALAISPRLQQFKQYQRTKDWDGTVEFVDSQLLKPISWRSPLKIFTCSMSDVFHESVPFDWIDRAFAVMAIAHQHTFQILTKRPSRMLEYFSEPHRARGISHRVCDILRDQKYPTKWRFKVPGGQVNIQIPLPNVWLGVSVENQKTAGDRIPLLLQTPAAIRFLSCEPLLEKIDLSEWLGEPIGEGICDACDERGILYAVDESPLAGGAICTKCCPRLDWVICGGESGDKAGPCHVDWLRSLTQQCSEAGVKVFVKQLGSNVISSSPYIEGVAESHHQLTFSDRKGGSIEEFPEDLRIREFPA